MNVVERVKAILVTPKTEWQAIETEPGDPAYLFTNYVAILAAIPAVCGFIGMTIAGRSAGGKPARPSAHSDWRRDRRRTNMKRGPLAGESVGARGKPS